MKPISQYNLESKHNEIWPVYVILQTTSFYQKFYEKWGLETSSKPLLIFCNMTGQISLTDFVLPKLFSKMYFLFYS